MSCDIFEVLIRNGLEETGCATIMRPGQPNEELAIKPGEGRTAFLNRARAYARGRGATQIVFEGLD